ncbi:MAG: hypothetical protein ACLGSD_17715 [Acidobacteriota bacterium]
MLLKKLQSPRTAVPVGMALIVVGVCLNPILAVSMRNLHFVHMGHDMADFWRGFMIGLGITLEIAGIMVMLPAVAAARRSGGRASQ